MKAVKTLDAVKKFSWPYFKTRVCEITLGYECNARCVFCYSSPEMEEWKNAHSLSVRKVCVYLLESRRAGALSVQFIGGEPTVYPELAKVVKAAKKAGYSIIQMVTNGQNFSDYSYASTLVESGLNAVVFSVHSHRASVHDGMVGVEGAFSRVLKSIGNAVRLGVYPSVGTAVTAVNYRDLPSLVRRFYEEFGIESYHFIATHFIGMAGMEKKRIKLSYSAQIPRLLEALDFMKNNGMFPVSPVLSNYLPCLMPGFEHIISDWKIPSSDDDLYLPEKKHSGKMYSMITDKLRVKRRKCLECVYSGICAGYEKAYSEIFGDSEFRPLKKIASPFPLPVFYRF